MKKSLNALISVGVASVVGWVIWYFCLPVINVQSGGFWAWVITIIFTGVTTFCGIEYYGLAKNYEDPKKYHYVLMGIPVVLTVIILLVALAHSPMFCAKKHANIISVEEAVFAEDMQDVDSVDNIALMDTETARVFGERALGSLSDIVSQYDLSYEYTQINYQGKPMKVAPLEYESFFKWCSNKETGIPGYVLVDPVKNTSTYVKLESPIIYSPSACFSKDLDRYLNRCYPSVLKGTSFFEIDDEGNPYWITATYERAWGLFGAKKVSGCIILNATNGETQLVSVEEIPSWVDVVFDGDYITELVNKYGMYQNGFLNSIFSQKGCKKCTDDFGYLSIEDDVWMYTGITSAAGDSSNIAVILCNERTGEIKYYPIAGADESSAMKAAEGEVQQYGYKASFPSLINVNGEATYIMVLIDDNNIVKMYAMVNMANYTKVVVADTQKEVFEKYAEIMEFDDVIDENIVLEEKTITVDKIQYIVIDGNTVVYVYSGDNIYKTSFDESWLKVEDGDTVNIKYNTADTDDIICIE